MRDPYTDPKAGDLFEGLYGMRTSVVDVFEGRVICAMSNGARSSPTLEQWPQAIRHARLIRRAEDVKP